MKTNRRVALAAAAFFIAGCATILGIDDGTSRDGGSTFEASIDSASEASSSDAGGSDATTDAVVAMCDTDAAFQPPIAFASLDTTANDDHLRLSSNELVGFFQSSRDGGLGSNDIYTATRTSIGDTWTNVAAVTVVNTSSADNEPSLSGDSLSLYFARSSNLYRSTRTTKTGAFGAPVLIPELGSSGTEAAPFIIDDGSQIYFSSTRDDVDGGVFQLFVAPALEDGGFGAVSAVNGTNLTSGTNRFSALTPDQLVMYFASSRSGGQGGYDIWLSTRASTSAAFAAPRVIAEVSSAKNEFPDWVSADRCRLYFTSDRATTGDDNVFVATRTP